MTSTFSPASASPSTAATTRSAYYREAVFIPPSDEVIAIASLLTMGGRDVTLACIFMLQSDFGWGEWERELRHINNVMRLNPTLPSWLVSSLRGGMRTELVLCSYGMTPRHGELMGLAMSPFCRIQRLVLMGNPLGSQGCKGLAAGLCSQDCTIQEVILDKCSVGDEGAQGLAIAIAASPRRLDTLQLEENHITEHGARALAAAILKNSRLSLLRLGGNYINRSGQEILLKAYEERGHGTVALSSRFFPQQREGPPPVALTSAEVVHWRLFATPRQQSFNFDAAAASSSVAGKSDAANKSTLRERGSQGCAID